MIERMRPFYQAHWDISNDIKHVWYFLYILHCMGFSVNSRWWGAVQGVDHPVCWGGEMMRPSRDSSCWFQEGLLSSRGGGGGRHTGTRLTKLWMKIVETKDVLRIKRFLLKNRLHPKWYWKFHKCSTGRSCENNALALAALCLYRPLAPPPAGVISPPPSVYLTWFMVSGNLPPQTHRPNLQLNILF